MKYKLFDDLLSVDLPRIFLQMDQIAKASDDEKKEVFTCSKTGEVILFILEDGDFKTEDLEKILQERQAMWKLLSKGFVMGEMLIRHNSGHELGVLTFQRSAVEKEGEEVFQIITYSLLGHRCLAIQYQCPLAYSLQGTLQFNEIINHISYDAKEEIP